MNTYRIFEVTVLPDGEHRTRIATIGGKPTKVYPSQGRAQCAADKLNDAESFAPADGPIKGYIVKPSE